MRSQGCCQRTSVLTPDLDAGSPGRLDVASPRVFPSKDRVVVTVGALLPRDGDGQERRCPVAVLVPHLYRRGLVRAGEERRRRDVQGRQPARGIARYLTTVHDGFDPAEPGRHVPSHIPAYVLQLQREAGSIVDAAARP